MYKYLEGFGNILKSEAVANTLPEINSPKEIDLYAEQISGTTFVLDRHKNKRTWLYRKYPSVDDEIDFETCDYLNYIINNTFTSPYPTRWKPLLYTVVKSLININNLKLLKDLFIINIIGCYYVLLTQ